MRSDSWMAGSARHFSCWLRPALVLGLACLPLLSRAVVLYFDGSGQRSITLRIGSNDATVNSVTFDVLNANIAPTPTPVTGVAGGGAPAVAPAGGMLFVITTNRRGGGGDVVRLTANSAGGLTCQSGVCLGAGITIPFTTISWTSYELFGGGFASGIPSGAFNGGGAQTLFTNSVPAGSDSLIATNVLLFQYANATLYPSGTYSGRVTYTLSVP